MIEFIDYYKVLKVDCSADFKIIQATFKKLSSIYHPDINKDSNAEEKYKIITEAYFVLKDPEKRKRYDEIYNRFTSKVIKISSKYCYYCGEKIPEEAVFCSKCGKQLKREESNNINYNTVTEKSFLNNVFRILEEFSLVSEYKNNQHSTAWSEDDPKEIKKEEAFLIKIKKLFNQLKDMQYPHNLIDERNKFVNIFEKLCHYKKFSIKGMQNGNYKNVLINERAFDIDVNSLFNYYDSLIKKE